MKATVKLSKLVTTMFAAALLFAMTSITTYAAEVKETETAETLAESSEEKEDVQNDTTLSNAHIKSLKDVEPTTTVDVPETSKVEINRISTAAKNVTEHTTTNTTTTKNTSTNASYSEADLKLLACMIYSESGNQPYAGKLLVGAVINNRKNSKLFPNTISGVIYQAGQFGPVSNGSFAAALSRFESGKFTTANEKESLKAAKEILSGVTTTSYNTKTIDLKGYLYFSGRIKGYKLQVGNHQFK